MSIVNEIIKLPLWLQLLLIGALLLAGQFWFTQAAQKISSMNWPRSHLLLLLKDVLISGLIALLAINYCVGKTAAGNPQAWMPIDRVLFVALTTQLTYFFTRFFSR